MNRIYGIIWGQCTPELQLVLKGNEDYNKKSKTFDLLWIIKEAKKITAGIYVKLNKWVNLHHTIRGFINMKQGKAEPNDAFKLCFDNVYETTAISGGGNILQRDKLDRNVS